MSLIKKPHELKTTKCIKMLIYGQPGIGKSTLALSAPQPLHVDFDGGVHRVRAEHLAPTVQVESWQNMIDLLSNEDLSQFKTLVIDTAGKMLDYMSAYIIANDSKMGRKDGQLSIQGYGARKGMFQRFLGQVGLMGKHVVFVAHEKEEKDGDQKIIRPEIGGSSGSDLIKDLDLVGYVEAKGRIRTISFDPCEKFYGKNTCGLDPLMNLKDLDKERNDMLVYVFDRFAKGLEARSAIMVNYSNLMESVQSRISEIEGAETANVFVEWAKKLDHIWDSNIQTRLMLSEKAKNIGLVWSGNQYQQAEQEVASVG